MDADVSVSPDQYERPQEPAIIRETERPGETAPRAAENEHSEQEHVKVEVFTKPRSLSIAEMEKFFETCGAYRGDETRPEVGGLKLWIY